MFPELISPYGLLLVSIISLLTSAGIYTLAIRMFRHYGLVDNPGPYGHDRAPVPLGIGIVLYINFAFLSLLLFPMTEKLLILIILWAIITGVSFLDDLDTIFKFDRSDTSIKKTATDMMSARKTRFHVSARVRLALQIFIGIVIGLTSIKISYVTNIFGGVTLLDAFSFNILGLDIYLIPLLFTVFWYVLVFNSVNWSDGIPGLTIGLGTITMIIIGILTVRFYISDDTPALRENSIFVFSVLAILLPSLLIGWYLNITPRILIGDSGTMFVAFMIASLAILVGGKVATVAVVLGVYLIDAFYVIVARILSKQSPLKGDRIHHLHFRLKTIGLSEVFIRNFVYLLAFFFGIAGTFLDKTGKIILFGMLALIIVFITKILAHKK